MDNKKVDLSAFTTVRNEVIAKIDGAWNNTYNSYFTYRVRDYSMEEIEQILNSSSLESLQKLSRNYYNKNGFYKRTLLYICIIPTFINDF